MQITNKIIEKHGLKIDEYKKITKITRKDYKRARKLLQYLNWSLLL